MMRPGNPNKHVVYVNFASVLSLKPNSMNLMKVILFSHTNLTIHDTLLSDLRCETETLGDGFRLACDIRRPI